ncbi:hypothetical protein [Magnetofaba australis]|nr:hypothetical protein [Magnetofaba australis]
MRDLDSGLNLIVLEVLLIGFVLMLLVVVSQEPHQLPAPVAPVAVSTPAPKVEQLPNKSAPPPEEAPPPAQPVVDSVRLARDTLLTQLVMELEAAGLKVEPQPNFGVLYLPNLLHFDRGQKSLRRDQRKRLVALVNTLERILPCYVASAYAATPCQESPSEIPLSGVYITGQSRFVGQDEPNFSANWSLALGRALATFKFLVNENPKLHALKGADGQALIRVGGMAASYDDTAQARRVELRFVMAHPQPKTDNDAQ